LKKIDSLKKWAYENIGKMDDAELLEVVEKQKRIWADQPESPAKVKELEHITEALESLLVEGKRNNSQSGAEQIVASALKEKRIQYVQQYPIGVYETTAGQTKARYYLDFLLEDYLNVEIDGVVWHDKDRDAFRDRHLKKLGYGVMRFPASQG